MDLYNLLCSGDDTLEDHMGDTFEDHMYEQVEALVNMDQRYFLWEENGDTFEDHMQGHMMQEALVSMDYLN